jgi:hypothetical protein
MKMRIAQSRWSAAERTRPATCNGKQLRRAKRRTKPKAGAANFGKEADLKFCQGTHHSAASKTDLLRHAAYKKRDGAISSSFQFNLSYPPTY